MKSRTTIIFWALVLGVVFFATLGGLYWFLRAYFGISPEGTLILIIPTFLIGGLACIYGFYYSIQQARLDAGQSSNWPAFASAFRINIFGLLFVIPAILSLYFLVVHRDITLTMIFAIMAAAISIWVTPKILEYWHRGGD